MTEPKLHSSVAPRACSYQSAASLALSTASITEIYTVMGCSSAAPMLSPLDEDPNAPAFPLLVPCGTASVVGSSPDTADSSGASLAGRLRDACHRRSWRLVPKSLTSAGCTWAAERPARPVKNQ